MKVRELIEKDIFEVVNQGDIEREIESVYCCDLLSIAMGRAPAGCCWVTVMGNINTVAVASLTDAGLVILAEGVSLDKMAASRAETQEINVLRTELPVFEAALKVHELLCQK